MLQPGFAKAVSKKFPIVASLLTILLGATAWGKEPTVAVRPEQAGISWELQGEYVGEVDGQQMGLQVVAASRKSLRAILFSGGLPGAGWNGEIERFSPGKIVDTIARLESAKSRVVIDGKTATLNKQCGKNGTLERIQRKSKTLGLKPPSEAKSLYSGKGTQKWKGARLYRKNLLASNCHTKQKFGDHSLHIEFRVPYMPEAKSQRRGNSGIYLQSRYEIQVLDSFGDDPKHSGCGGIYEVGTPLLNMCYPPLSWQTFDIDFTAARWEGQKKVEDATVTVRLNGVTIHDKLALPSQTPGRWKERPSPGALFLQDQGDPVMFRNIWVVAR